MTINLKNFLNDKRKMSKMGEFQELKTIDGLEISSISADLYGNGRDDLSLFYFKEGANFAAVYTTNKVTSAAINWNLKVKRHFVKALMVNTKNANHKKSEKYEAKQKKYQKIQKYHQISPAARPRL